MLRRPRALAALALAVAGAAGVPAALAAAPSPLEREIARIAAAVERIRGLQFRRPVRPALLTPAAFGARVSRVVLHEYRPRDADVDQRALGALGAIPAASDLRALQADSAKDEVAGFYDSRTKALVVRVGRTGGLDAIERITLAHELDHALTDQALGLPKDPTAVLATDAQLAASGLVEGDATVTMVVYGLGLGPGAVTSPPDADALGGPSAAALPPFLRQALVYPYFDGSVFVNALRADGGWRRVDAAYRTPPTTTAQILFPTRYLRGEGAIAPAPLGRLPRPWRPARVQSFGAAPLMWLFAAPGGRTSRRLPDPRASAAAWAGGTMAVWTSGPRTALGLALVQRRGARGLCGSVAAWYRRGFPAAAAVARRAGERLAVRGSRQSAVLVCAGDQVRLGIAPGLPAARRLADT